MNFIEVSAKNLESILPVYLNTEYIIQPEYQVFRTDRKSFRYYLKVIENTDVSTGLKHNMTFIAPSVTSIISNSEPISHGLLKWYADNGMEYCQNYLEQSANYGTFIHSCYAEILRGKTFQLNEDLLKAEMKFFYEDNGFDFYAGWKWYRDNGRDIRKDLFGFVKFCKDYKIRPLAVEFTVFNEEKCYAGTADLVCKMTLTHKVRGKDEYTEEEVLAIVDFKTGENHYNSHAIQLEGLRQGWNAMYPEMKVEKVFNLNCKNYRLPLKDSVDPYSLKEQTESEHAFLWDVWLDVFHKQHPVDKLTFSDFMDVEIGFDIPIPEKFQEEKHIFAEVLDVVKFSKETLF